MKRPKSILRSKTIRVLACLPAIAFLAAPECRADAREGLMRTVGELAAVQDRSTGSPGCIRAAAFIQAEFQAAGAGPVAVHRFTVPVRRWEKSRLTTEDGRRLTIHPLLLNAAAPETSAAMNTLAQLIYVGRGALADFNHQPVKDAIVLMDMDSGGNWRNAAALGARALIFLDGGISRDGNPEPTPNLFYKEKIELTPLHFPRFRVSRSAFNAWLGRDAGDGLKSPLPKATLFSRIAWENVVAENVYTKIEGRDPRLKKNLLVVEAFYDSTPLVAGLSPGADEALGVAGLISLAGFLKKHPPARSVLLVATSGHAQTLSGFRELVWSLRNETSFQAEREKHLRLELATADRCLSTLEKLARPNLPDDLSHTDIQAAITSQLKNRIDSISRKLIRLRMDPQNRNDTERTHLLVQDRQALQRLEWKNDLSVLSPEEVMRIRELLPSAVQQHRDYREAARLQLDLLESSRIFQECLAGQTISAVICLHLSSHGDGFGAFNKGWLYPLKPTVDRLRAYGALERCLQACALKTAASTGHPSMLADTLRPGSLKDWQSYLADRPELGGEVASLAGYPGISLVTVHDGRFFWGTPDDLPGNMDWEYAARQNAAVCSMIRDLAAHPGLESNKQPADGFSTVSGRVRRMRHGELFADRPVAGALVMAFQGTSRYYAMTDARGDFQLKGVCDKKHVLDKLIIEAFHFQPATGKIIAAIDKRLTGKDAYRLKIKRKDMRTDLILFTCRQTTLFDLLEPRNFNYMTKIELLDGFRDAPPLTYSYSRIDTRSSSMAAVFMEPRSRLKIILSDNLLSKKLLLTGTEPSHPQGIGYRAEDWPSLTYGSFRAATDMWALLSPRIANLESHGIFDESIRRIEDRGLKSLADARRYLDEGLYDRFHGAASTALALASRVYDQVDRTQKDVLFGVLFYIAFFVPFAFCMERLLFACTDIHKRILAFCGILALLVAIIYWVHPAFQLAYNPLVVVLAFIIISLSLLVTLIIFFRFEAEMARLQRHASPLHLSEISRGKAFLAAFFLGADNLRRRPLRTGLTCITLIILTFTIMSFTTVKTARHHSRVRFRDDPAYQGLLFKKGNWQSLPPETVSALAGAFSHGDIIAPRVWLEADDPTRPARIPIGHGDRVFDARGMLGLAENEVHVTGMARLLTGGRWFTANERQAVILPDRMAAHLGIDPESPEGASVRIWGRPFDVVGVFSGSRFRRYADLDGEPLTPVTFPDEIVTELSEVEMEAVEAGEDITDFQSRYEHVDADLTVILPFRTVAAAGGALKSIAVGMHPTADIGAIARKMVDRFGLSLFSGEGRNGYLHQGGDAIRYSGSPDIFIPICISILIVLNTMIGSVHERKREIGIYTSIGLAPSHVAFLFIAEALAFAVISVVIGYIVAQISATLFGGISFWSGITVNYSSLSGVAAMLLVVMVVLVSVVYPAKTAASIAIPDVNRSWTLPESRDSVMELSLPFMIQSRELSSVCSHLQAYFKAHQDVSHGLFSTGEMTTVHPEASPEFHPRPDVPACAQLRQKVWLAPFDFGIMQLVTLSFRSSGSGCGMLEMTVRLERKSGETNAWWRINKVFLNRLRKQLLIWRSLEKDARSGSGGICYD
ncbi:MAG: FtsX-like permease family protein [Thermodesulfobacteriota bacterium]